MSWRKKEYREKYNRGTLLSGKKSLEQAIDDQEWMNEELWRDYHAAESQRSMDEIRTCQLLYLLKMLGIRSAVYLLRDLGCHW